MSATATGTAPAHLPIALVGFSAFERQALGSYLRLMEQRRPGYTAVDKPEQARLLVVDADHPGFAQQVQRAGRRHEAVYVASKVAADGGAWMQRPIDPQHLLRELDVLATLLQAEPAPVAPPAAAPVAPPAPVAPVTPVAPEPAAPPLQLRPPSPVRGALPVLVVDDSDIALRLLEKTLTDLGFTPYCARNGQEALALLAREAFAAVLLDIDLGEHSTLDGLALCQRIKREHIHLGDTPPPVALVTAHHGAMQRVRADLAGADAFLTKPLDLDALRVLLKPLQAGLSAGA